MCVQYKSFENTLGKGEIAHNEQFLLFPQCFLTLFKNFLTVLTNLKLSCSNSLSLEESKICCLGKGYNTPLPEDKNRLFMLMTFADDMLNMFQMSLCF